MKTYKARMTLTGVVLAVLTATTAFAYKPSGWAYTNYPYLYESTNTEWAYFRTTDTPQVVNLATRWTGQLKNATMANASWNYWTQYPYVYCSKNRNWYYFYRSNSQWVRNMVTGQWSVLGTTVARTGEIQFKLTWDKPNVDLDLWVTVRGETIKHNHKIGTAGAIGGVLDVDDRDGYGPENIYWQTGKAPQPASGQYIMFQPTIHYYSGGVDVNYTLEIRATGWRNQMSTGERLPYYHRGTFRANESGLTDLSKSLHYYGR
jgi:hypothetical protein